MEVILFIIIAIAIGVGLFNHGAKLGAETSKLKDEVNAFSEKYKVNINWFTSVPHETNEMIWVAYSYPDNDFVHYEVHHNVGFYRVLKAFDNSGAIYTSNYFQFYKLIFFNSSKDIIRFNEQKKNHNKVNNDLKNPNEDFLAKKPDSISQNSYDEIQEALKEARDKREMRGYKSEDYSEELFIHPPKSGKMPSQTNMQEFNFKPLSPEEVEKRRVPIHCNPGKSLDEIHNENIILEELKQQHNQKR